MKRMVFVLCIFSRFYFMPSIYGQTNEELQNELKNSFANQDFAKAEQISEKICKNVESLVGKNSDSYASALADLGLIKYILAKLNEAEKCLTETIEIVKKIEPLNKRTLSNCLTNLGKVYTAQRRYGYAENCFLDALNIIKQFYGVNSSEYYTTIGYLAEHYEAAGKPEQAKENYSKAVAFYENNPQQDRNVYYILLNRLANLNEAAGNIRGADSIATKLVWVIKKESDTTNYLFANASIYKATIKYKIGEKKLAKEILKNAIAIYENNIGTASADYADAIYMYAKILSDDGQFREAAKKYDLAEKIILATEGKSLKYAAILGDIGKIKIALSDLKGAETVLNMAVKIYSEKGGTNSGEYMSLLKTLASFDMNKGDYFQAKKRISAALSSAEKNYGNNSLQTALLTGELAGIYFKDGNLQAADSLYDRSKNIFIAIREESSIDYAVVLSNYANVHHNLGKLDLAIETVKKSLAIFEIKKDLGSLQYANTLNNYAILLFNFYRFSEADSIYKRSLAIIEKTEGKISRTYANSIFNLAMLKMKSGIYTESRTLFNSAKDISDALPVEANSYIPYTEGLAELEYSVGNLQIADSLFVIALKNISVTVGKTHPDYALTLCKTGSLYAAEGQFIKAKASYEEALDLTERYREAEHPLRLTLLQNLAGFYYTTGQFSKAETYFKLAENMAIKKYGENSIEYCNVLGSTGLLLIKMGRYNEAEPMLNKCIKTRKSILGENHPSISGDYNSLGLLYASMGRLPEAAKLYSSAIELLNKTAGENHPNYSVYLNNLAVTKVKLKEFSGADSLYKQALNLIKNNLGKEHPNYASTLNNLAGIYYNNNEFEKAEPFVKEAMEIYKSKLGEDHPDYASSLNSYGLLLLNLKKYIQAETILQSALKIKENVFGGNHPSLSLPLNNLALLYEAMEDFPLAETYYERANKNLMFQLDTYFPSLSDKEKSEFFATMTEEINLYNLFGLKRHKNNSLILTKIYENHISTKSILFNSSQKVRKSILSGKDAGLKEQYKKYTELREYLAKVYNLSKSEIKKQKIKVDSLETALNSYEKKINSLSSNFNKEFETAKISFAAVQKSLADNEAVVEIIRINELGKNRADSVYYAALIITKETVINPDIEIFHNGKELESTIVTKYKESIQQKKDDPQIYSYFWEKIERRLTGKVNVFFSAEGVFNQINLLTLIDAENNFLINKKNIYLLSNSRDIIALKKEKQFASSHKHSSSLFGYPNYRMNAEVYSSIAAKYRKESDLAKDFKSGEFEELTKIKPTDLPGTKIEVENIKKILEKDNWQVTSFLGNEAIEEAIKNVKSPGILHIATHGFFLPAAEKQSSSLFGNADDRASDNPLLRSGLLFAGAQSYLNNQLTSATDNGILTAYEVMNLELDSTALVVLSACETGLGELKKGEGISGLQRAFQVAGAKTVIMSLWKVSDEITKELMIAFYSNLATEPDTYKSFKKAQITVMQKHKSPVYWGAFVIAGAI